MICKTLKCCALLGVLFSFRDTIAAESPVIDLSGSASFQEWSALDHSFAAGAVLELPGNTVWKASNGPLNVLNAYGLRVTCTLQDKTPVILEVKLGSRDNDEEWPATARLTIEGEGLYTFTLPWSNFDYRKSFDGFLEHVSRLQVSAKRNDGSAGKIIFNNVAVIDAATVSLRAEVQGQAVGPGQKATYQVAVGNCTQQPQWVTLGFDRDGFSAMSATVEPSMVRLEPGAQTNVTVSVDVPARVPPGAQEKQLLRALANGNGSASAMIEFITAARQEHPYILHTKSGWDEVRQKIAHYDWAKAANDEYVSRSDRWQVPSVKKPENPKRGDALFATQVEDSLMAAGIAYQTTLDTRHAEKVRQFLLNLSNPANGYPVTHRGCDQASVQEGHFFQHIAMAYDMAIPSGVFTEADRRQIDATLRLFVGKPASADGNISNWAISYQCGQLYAALDLQDLQAADRFLHGRGQLLDQFVQGTLNDGWWFEVSVSYNTWCASEFSQIAIAMRPWGVDLVNQQFPAALRPSDQKPASEEIFGMSRAHWGPIARTSIGFKAMWDALPPMIDYRGVMFGLNDSTERAVGGSAMEIAYYLYRDPAYAAAIKRSNEKRDLLYGVPELPDATQDDPSRKSAYADNAGVAVLRSQAATRPASEQIQAVIHYGDHGWFHGHFDRTDLVHLSRYGRSFYNPEFTWFGYPSFMYKFYVQTSVNKNMVVVDQKMQEPVESKRLLFHSGKMMQAVAVETDARWSNPPYGGMTYGDQPFKTPQEKAFAEGRFLPDAKNAPAYGAVTDYTEPVQQRRLVVVTDDYVLLVDHLKGEREHTYESLFQMKGFQGFLGALKPTSHTNQWSTDPLSSAQFVTDCDWYTAQAPVRGSYEFRWGPGADNAGTRTELNSDGVLKIDLHSLWPQQQQIMVGTPPEAHNVQKQATWNVIGDGKTLASGKFGAWVLGRADIDVPVAGVKSLTLSTHTDTSKTPTLFWAGARLVKADGSEIPLTNLPVQYQNVTPSKSADTDYFGGPIKIVGERFGSALPAQPQNVKKEGICTLDLTGLNATRFKATFGGDFPLGDEAQRRKTVTSKIVAKEATFITLLEPFENNRMVRRAEAISPTKIHIELMDGRTQTLAIENFESTGENIRVKLVETQAGTVTGEESTETSN